MPVIPLFAHLLVISLKDVLANGGWKQPGYLFALRGGDDQDLQYLLQIPGSVVEFLPTLLGLGLGAAPGVLGLAVVSLASNPDGPCRASVLGLLRDGGIQVATITEGGDIVMTDRLPDVQGDHDQVVELLSRLMHRPVVPDQRAS